MMFYIEVWLWNHAFCMYISGCSVHGRSCRNSTNSRKLLGGGGELLSELYPHYLTPDGEYHLAAKKCTTVKPHVYH